MLLLALLPSAAAVDDQSLRAYASFGLFRDEYDYLQEPATLGRQPGRHLFTLLGNQGGTSRFSLGYVGTLGPGVLGVIGDGGLDRSVSAAAEVAAPTAGTDTITTEDEARSTAWVGSALLGYGLPVGERVSVGAGISASVSRWDATLAPDPGSTPIIAGTLTSVTEDGGASSVETGTWRQDAVELSGAAGAAFDLGRLSIDLEGNVAWLRDDAAGDTTLTSDTVSYAWSGALLVSSLDDNRSGWVPGGSVDAVFAASEAVAVRLQVDAAYGVLQPVTTRSFESYDDTTDPDVPSGFSEDLNVRDARLSVAQGGALLAVQYHRGPIAVRTGVQVTGVRDEAAYVLDSARYEVGGDTEDTSTDRDIVSGVYSVALPVAVEITAGERFFLRTGAQWALYGNSSDTRTTLASSPGEGDVTDETRSSQTDLSYLQYALGFRYVPVPAFSLDAVAIGTGLPDQRLTVNLTDLVVSGVFHF